MQQKGMMDAGCWSLPTRHYYILTRTGPPILEYHRMWQLYTLIAALAWNTVENPLEEVRLPREAVIFGRVKRTVGERDASHLSSYFPTRFP